MWNYRISSVWGIPIRINISLLVFLPVLAWLIGSGEQIAIYTGFINGFTSSPLDVTTLRAGNTPWVIGSLAAIGLFISVVRHELGHSQAARQYGIHTESITLWLLGGLFRIVVRLYLGFGQGRWTRLLLSLFHLVQPFKCGVGVELLGLNGARCRITFLGFDWEKTR